MLKNTKYFVKTQLKCKSRFVFSIRRSLHQSSFQLLNDRMKNFVVRAMQSSYFDDKEGIQVQNLDREERKRKLEEQGVLSWDPFNIEEDKQTIRELIQSCTSENIPREIDLLMGELGLKATQAEVYNLLVRLNLFKKDENIHLYSFRHLLKPPKSVFESSNKKYKKHLGNIIVGDRTVLKDSIFTIDGETAHEIDDAVSITKKGNDIEYLMVHIADPTELLEVGDEMERFARYRTSTIYLPDKVFPMFPANFSQDLCSIKRGQDNYALTFAIKIDNSDGMRISDLKIMPSVLKDVTTLVYENVDKYLETRDASHLGNVVPGANPENLFEVEQLTKSLRNNRKAKSLLGLSEEDKSQSYHNVDISLDPSGDIQISRNLGQLSKSRKLIEECMISAGASVGAFSVKNKIPLIYRLQTLASEAPPSVFEDTVADFPIENIPCDNKNAMEIIQNLTKKIRFSYFSDNPNFHGDLNLSAYCFVTSPLRRFADVVNHFQLKSFVRNQPYPYSQKDLFNISGNLFKFARELHSLEKKSDRFWTLKYLEKNMDKIYQSVLLKNRFYKNYDYETNTFKANSTHSLILLDLLLTVDWKIPRDISYGEIFNVKCTHVDPLSGKVEVEVV